MKKKIELNEYDVFELYINQKLNLLETSEILGCSDSALRRNMKEMGIETRGHNEFGNNKTNVYIERELLIKYYDKEGFCLRKTSKILNTSVFILLRLLRENGIHIRNKKEAKKFSPTWNKGETKKTNKILQKVSELVMKTKAVDLDEAIKNKQRFITTSQDLVRYGYAKNQILENNRFVWMSKEVIDERADLAKTDGFRNMKHKNYIKKQEYYLKKIREYQQTSKGRMVSMKTTYKRRKRGFIPLNEALDIPHDWHHISKELPFVMAIDRKIHKSCYGKKHYDSVNEQIGLNEIVGKSKEDIEYYIELNYPDEFKIYWFGNY